MEKNIIAIVGMCGSGKSVAGEYLESLGFERVYFGGLTIEEVEKRGLEVNEENERHVREEFRETHGMGAFAVLSLPKIRELRKKDKRVLIDGLYSFSEYKTLREKYGDELFMIAVFTPKELRYARLNSRTVRPLTRTEAISRDYAEIENIEKGGPIALADDTIHNSGSKENLIKALKIVLKGVGIE